MTEWSQSPRINEKDPSLTSKIYHVEQFSLPSWWMSDSLCWTTHQHRELEMWEFHPTIECIHLDQNGIEWNQLSKGMISSGNTKLEVSIWGHRDTFEVDTQVKDPKQIPKGAPSRFPPEGHHE